MDSTPRRRARSTGPSRSGSGSRAGRGQGSARTRRADAVVQGSDEAGPSAADSDSESIQPTVGGESPPVVSAEMAEMAEMAEIKPRRSRPGRRRNGRIATSRPAGTRPGNARSAVSTGGGRRVGRISARGMIAPAAAGTKSRLAKQVAILGLVFCAVALALAVPLRDYLAQRAALQSAMSQEQQLDDQLASLEQKEAALSDPAYIRSEAKRRLQYVMPGDTVYSIHAPALPVPKAAGATVTVPTVPWYSSLWNTLSDPPAGAVPAKLGGKATR